MQENDIIITLDVMLAVRKMSVTELAERIEVHPTNLSIFKNGKGQSIKLKSLMRMCQVLDCTPNDIIKFREPASKNEDAPREETMRKFN